MEEVFSFQESPGQPPVGTRNGPAHVKAGGWSEGGGFTDLQHGNGNRFRKTDVGPHSPSSPGRRYHVPRSCLWEVVPRERQERLSRARALPVPRRSCVVGQARPLGPPRRPHPSEDSSDSGLSPSLSASPHWDSKTTVVIREKPVTLPPCLDADSLPAAPGSVKIHRGRPAA